MATILDILIVELALDPKKFTKGQREAYAEAKRTLQQGQAAGNAIERQADTINNTLSRLKGQALSFFGLLAGGGGLAAFIVKTTTADAQVSRFSRSLGVQIQDIAAWRKAVEAAGGTAEGFDATVSGLTKAFQEFESYHQPIPFQPTIDTLDAESKRLGGPGVALIDAAGKLRPIGDFLKELAFVFEKMGDPAKAKTFAEKIGIVDPGLFDLLLKGPVETAKRLNEALKIGVVTKAEAEQAERLAKAWHNASESVVSMGRGLLDVVSPTFIDILNTITKIASQDNDTKLRQDISQLGRMRDELETMKKGSQRYANQEQLIKKKEESVETRLRARAELDTVPETTTPKASSLNAPDRDLLVRTVIGEAKGQGEQGEAAVAHVAMNRLQSGRYGGTMEKVLFAPKQFEPWETRKNELMNISPESADYRRVSALVERVLAGQVPDPTKGATHFANEAVVAARGNTAALSWIEQMKRNGTAIQIGAHTFGRPEAQPGAIKPPGTGQPPPTAPRTVQAAPTAPPAAAATAPPTAQAATAASQASPAAAPAVAPVAPAVAPAPASAAATDAPAASPTASAYDDTAMMLRRLRERMNSPSPAAATPMAPPAAPAAPPLAPAWPTSHALPATAPRREIPPGPLGERPGAASAAMAAATVANDNRATTTSTTDIKIENLIVQTQAPVTDAAAVANDIRGAIERSRLAVQANSGPQ